MTDDKEAKLAALMKLDVVELDKQAALDEGAIEPPSSMQQALLDSGARQIEGIVPTFATNEGTVFLASPADIARLQMMDTVQVHRGHTYFASNAEIDRLMKEDKD